MLQLKFESDFQSKVLYISFVESSVLKSQDDINKWKSQWLDALKVWHSPYKAMVDCKNLSVESKTKDFQESLDLLVPFLKGFFLKKIVGYNFSEEQGHRFLPFKVELSKEEAVKELGIRVRKFNPDTDDLRSVIQFQNFFKGHIIECSFLKVTKFETQESLNVFKSKLLNNLMLWHSKWSLLIDCSKFDINPDIFQLFEEMLKFFKGFFLQDIIGYNCLDKDKKYPFKTVRSRHKALSILTVDEQELGDQANCSQRKVSK